MRDKHISSICVSISCDRVGLVVPRNTEKEREREFFQKRHESLSICQSQGHAKSTTYQVPNFRESSRPNATE
eukprot:m.129682 g.129682  ORF g.129682 m.129682 type:complete len:72 (+) comp15703_c0_seq2:814-1029(+)